MYDTIVPTYSFNMPFADFVIYAVRFSLDFALLYFSFLGLKLGLSFIDYATK